MSLLNPIPALVTRTQMIRGGAGGGNVPAPVLLHCLVILIAAAACLALAVRRVRRVALALEGRPSNAALIYLHRAPETVVNRKRAARPIRRVEGQPIVWREMRASSWGTGRQVLSSILLWVLVAGLIAPMIASQAMLASGFLIPIWILHWLLVIRLAVTAGGAVTREKEARTWALLLTTPLDDAEIVKSKASAALRRNAGLLVLLLPLYLVLALQGPGQSFPGLIFSTYGGVAGTVVFLLGVGLYLSTRLKTTAGAVVGTLGLYLAPKLFFCGGAGPWLLLAARGPLGAFQGPVTVTLVAVSLIPAAFYAAAGLACLRAATRRLRRDIF
jgi:hypothetical protein